MKNRILLAISVLFLCLAGWVYAQNPWLGKTLKPLDVRAKWGDVEFNEAKFKSGSQGERAKMAYSLMTGKKMIGLSPIEIRNRLGDFSGHYFSESYPTYLIQEARQRGEESWQLVFLIDRDLKIKNIIVHKNCCD